MKIEFEKKTGKMIRNLALELLKYSEGDYIKSISEFEKDYQVSRGTVQNAMNYLKKQKIIVTKSRGYLGTCVEELDYKRLNELAFPEVITGTMTLPYSRLYEGFATGIYKTFNKQGIKINLAYLRGSDERIKAIVNETYDFAVVSKFAANQSLIDGAPIKIIADFGEGTYLSQHVLLFKNSCLKKIEVGMRVAIDYASIDQTALTKMLIRDKDIKLVEIPGHQIISAIREDIIDTGVWNYDEIKDKKIDDLHFKLINFKSDFKAVSSAVIVIHKKNMAIKRMLDTVIEQSEIIDIQNEVIKGNIVPSY